MLYIVAYILNIADFVLTWFGCRKYGIETEVNPIGRWLIRSRFLFFVKIIVIGLLILVLFAYRHSIASRIGIIIITAAYSLICINWILIFIVWGNNETTSNHI